MGRYSALGGFAANSLDMQQKRFSAFWRERRTERGEGEHANLYLPCNYRRTRSGLSLSPRAPGAP